ncbi:MAG: protein translocase, partial [Clostridiales bacterium]|nr:protein translocase [Clostridiales bacterium]
AVTLQNIETRTISPTLGSDAIRSALIAGAIGIAIVFIFMAVAYRMLGVAADIALIIYILLLLWFCAVLPWVQLTLPGIAGIILGIGMAVDANIVIFERIKDEYKMTNKPLPSAVKNGFKRSLGAIIDGNVTTLIGAVILWIVGSASIVGFAITLFISIIISMFTALVVTRVILKCFMSFTYQDDKSRKVKTLSKEEREANYEKKIKYNEKLYGLRRRKEGEIAEKSFALAASNGEVSEQND